MSFILWTLMMVVVVASSSGERFNCKDSIFVDSGVGDVSVTQVLEFIQSQNLSVTNFACKNDGLTGEIPAEFFKLLPNLTRL